MNGAPSDLESAIGWLGAQTAETQYGHVAIEAVISDGNIVRIITKSEISHASIPTNQRGQRNGQR